MLKYFLLLSLSLTLFAKNPLVYSALGDVIYNNSMKIKKLSEIHEYIQYKEQIIQYLANVDSTKDDGFKIDSGNKIIDKKNYLMSLRNYSSKNDFYIRSAQRYFKESIEQSNHLLFSQLINSGMIDTIKEKEIILTYYYDHKKNIDPSGVIQNYLDEDKALCALHERKRQLRKTKAMLEKEKIERIRLKDQSEQKKLEKKLDDELNSKKIEIRKNQQKELFN